MGSGLGPGRLALGRAPVCALPGPARPAVTRASAPPPPLHVPAVPCQLPVARKERYGLRVPLVWVTRIARIVTRCGEAI